MGSSVIVIKAGVRSPCLYTVRYVGVAEVLVL